jgi:hypothetical protein
MHRRYGNAPLSDCLGKTLSGPCRGTPRSLDKHSGVQGGLAHLGPVRLMDERTGLLKSPSASPSSEGAPSVVSPAPASAPLVRSGDGPGRHDRLPQRFVRRDGFGFRNGPRYGALEGQR